LILKKSFGRVWTGLTWFVTEIHVAGCCEHGDEPSDSVSWLASQTGLCSLDLVSCLVGWLVGLLEVKLWRTYERRNTCVTEQRCLFTGKFYAVLRTAKSFGFLPQSCLWTDRAVVEFRNCCNVILKVDQPSAVNKFFCAHQNMLHVQVSTDHPHTLNTWYVQCGYSHFIYMHFILTFKYHIFNAWGRSVLTSKCSVCWRDTFCCGGRYTSVCLHTATGWIIQKWRHNTPSSPNFFSPT
jgi:hypothetical protein